MKTAGIRPRRPAESEWPRLEELNAVPAARRDHGWACDTCKESRYAHIKVLSVCLSKAAVARLLVLLKSLHRKLAAIENCGIYYRNVATRLNSIESVHNKGVPISVPNPIKKELAAMKDAWRRHLVGRKGQKRPSKGALRRAQSRASAG